MCIVKVLYNYFDLFVCIYSCWVVVFFKIIFLKVVMSSCLFRLMVTCMFTYIWHPSGKTTIVSKPVDDQVSYGEEAHFRCVAKTDPHETNNLRYYWLKNGERLNTSDPRVSLSMGEHISFSPAESFDLWKKYVASEELVLSVGSYI